MDLQGKAVQQTPQTQAKNVDPEHRQFMHSLNMYLIPPNGESMLLDQFEALGIRRLKLLRCIEDAELQTKRGEQLKAYIEERAEKDGEINELVKLGTDCGPDTLSTHLGSRKQDVLSHFVLRMAFCATEENRRWLVQQETELFRCRFSQFHIHGKSFEWFFAASGLKYRQVNAVEKAALFEYLKSCTAYNDITFDNKSLSYRPPEQQVESRTIAYDFYETDFLEALDLVKRRAVFLKDGVAYVPEPLLVDVIASRFQENLANSLEALAHRLPHQDEEHRLLPLYNRITLMYTGKHFTEKNSNLKVDIEDLDKLSRQSFPLCMQHLHATLRKEHHLKHDGRMQYGLFLKGIGLTLEQALIFWRQEFSRAPGMDPQKFDKNYVYNIRHNYGQEGARKNYTPYSCMKIIMGSEGKAGDAQGCPFRNFDALSLKHLVEKNGVTGERQREILAKSKEKHFQVACTRYFESVHNLAPHSKSEPINHPNQYFNDSAQHYQYEQQQQQPVAGGQKVENLIAVVSNSTATLENNEITSAAVEANKSDNSTATTIKEANDDINEPPTKKFAALQENLPATSELSAVSTSSEVVKDTAAAMVVVDESPAALDIPILQVVGIN